MARTALVDLPPFCQDLLLVCRVHREDPSVCNEESRIGTVSRHVQRAHCKPVALTQQREGNSVRFGGYWATENNRNSAPKRCVKDAQEITGIRKRTHTHTDTHEIPHAHQGCHPIPVSESQTLPGRPQPLPPAAPGPLGRLSLQCAPPAPKLPLQSRGCCPPLQNGETRALMGRGCEAHGRPYPSFKQISPPLIKLNPIVDC